jgi:hypothetical protein
MRAKSDFFAAGELVTRKEWLIMENHRKIDRSFKERQGVLQLLEKLKKENITYAEMDEIGNKLKKTGRSAVQPILRRLWKEKSGTLISKYTYLLDFLDDRYWLDQIIQIALKRRDLEIEGKSAILSALEDCGIDVSMPPFAALFSGASVPVAEMFPQMVETGDEGLLFFLEDIAWMPIEIKRTFLLELAGIPDRRVLEPLGLLLWHDDSEVVKEVITAIGRVRFPEAASLLKEYREYAESPLQQLVDQSIRRLSFVGIYPETDVPVAKRKPFHSAYAGPVDGNGYRHIWISRWREDGRIDSVDFQIHDLEGVKSVWGENGETVDQYEERAAERTGQELIESAAPEYVLALLCDALFKSREGGYPLPPEFLLRRRIFAPEEIIPSEYDLPSLNWHVKVTPSLLTLSAKLFEDEFFAGWSLESCKVYDIAEEWIRLEKGSSEKELASALERLIESLCREELKPILADISRRLYLNADYLARNGVDGELVKAAVAAAASIKQFSLPCHLHPFLRRFAMESMIVAREALEEGYDMRDFPEEEWE